MDIELDLTELAQGAGLFAMAIRPEWNLIRAAAVARRDGLTEEAELCREAAGYGGLHDNHQIAGEV